jgi:type IV pilus assembly protein PilC
MPVFLWQAKTKKGETKKGEMEGADEAAVRGRLRRQGLTVEKIKPKPKDLFENIAFFQPK